jgi:hypothetical protein
MRDAERRARLCTSYTPTNRPCTSAYSLLGDIGADLVLRRSLPRQPNLRRPGQWRREQAAAEAAVWLSVSAWMVCAGVLMSSMRGGWLATHAGRSANRSPYQSNSVPHIYPQ